MIFPNSISPTVIQKEVKGITLTIVNEVKIRRDSDFQEETEQSEHNTSCETHLDFNLVHKAGDF